MTASKRRYLEQSFLILPVQFVGSIWAFSILLHMDGLPYPIPSPPPVWPSISCACLFCSCICKCFFYLVLDFLKINWVKQAITMISRCLLISLVNPPNLSVDPHNPQSMYSCLPIQKPIENRFVIMPLTSYYFCKVIFHWFFSLLCGCTVAWP